jgi:hypothetical protein
MADNIDIFDTLYLLGMAQEINPVPSFFKDRYFGEEETFTQDKVLIEFMNGDQKMVPFIAPKVGDIPVDREGYELYEFAPSLIAPSRILTLDDLAKRGFGEPLLSGSTKADRARAIQFRDLRDLSARIGRCEEWMAAQTMINNGFDMQEYIDANTAGKTIPVRFYDTGGSNPAVYTVTPWSSWASAKSDITAMCDELTERGLPATDLVLGSTTWGTISGFSGFYDDLDNRSIDIGVIRASLAGTGVSYMGRLNIDGYNLDVFVAREKYKDASGVAQSYFPAKSAMVTAPGCGKTAYGAVTQIDFGSSEFSTYEGKRIPKLTIEQNNDIRKLRLASRPFTAPKNMAPWMYAANAVL